MGTKLFEAGGYRFIPCAARYSGGVAAEHGYRIERARFSRVVPLREGFERIERHLDAMGRPTTAFCACELRSPEPFTAAGFRQFNDSYVGTLSRWGLLADKDTNPVARSNVCPEVNPPGEPGFYAFSYTVPDEEALQSFVVAGSAEVPEVEGASIVALDDVSPEGLRTKARWVLGEMENRLRALGFDWASVTGTQLYTVHDVHPILEAELVRRGAMRSGLTWHFARPPVLRLEYEMDCRGVSLERVIEP